MLQSGGATPLPDRGLRIHVQASTDAEMNDNRALFRQSQKHWQRPEEEGNDEDDVGKAKQSHFQAGV